jgi:hypothetical protein
MHGNYNWNFLFIYSYIEEVWSMFQEPKCEWEEEEYFENCKKKYKALRYDQQNLLLAIKINNLFNTKIYIF